ncbi:AlpA family phage regulatory protein [Herbaspirillum sp. RTI4]|uniref:helix-turn-helix transcriptional regulator n=1 Tax=Herbaspirillum sp. RTI4 TaxID=3048640 RepID=UPI002AB5BD0E|nr:AlpA family phage regulatory protein [Herbaspirillum sp. RTI4]MDY7580078.1 AlpA family phage regulatory protein [Herbaspirillum sp. RTI4]MEA9983305.1 AlpA family phage regulatory protein [Herbaspirillum sp. RTI4]
MHYLPETGYLRLSQIIGNKKANPITVPIIPISRSSWLTGVKTGRFPQPIKLGSRTTVWRVEDIRGLIEQTGCHSVSQVTIHATKGE